MSKEIKQESNDKYWKWWPLFPLYPYGYKKTIFNELLPDQVWSFEQLQGLYYVAVPIRMTVIKVDDGLMIINPLPPTKELIKGLEILVSKYGEVKTIVLPTASGLEHKIGLPALVRIFDKSDIWVCPGQWSFPINLPLSFIGIPKKRTKVLFEEGVPHQKHCKWSSLGPINLGLGRFQEISCFHCPSKALIVTDAIVGISSNPPAIFDDDPTPLIFHSRDRGDEPLLDSQEARNKGWSRLILFSSFLRPSKLRIPSLFYIFKYAFKKGLRNKKAHFGIYPFLWEKNWEDSLINIMGEDLPKIQVAPVLQKLIFPRSKEILCMWLDDVKDYDDMKYLISAHYSSLINFTKTECKNLLEDIQSGRWDNSPLDSNFLTNFYNKLSELNIIPDDQRI